MDYPVSPRPDVGDLSVWKKYFNPKTPLLSTEDFEKAAFSTDASRWVGFWNMNTPVFQERLRPLLLQSLDEDDFDAWCDKVIFNEVKRMVQVTTRNGATISDIGGAMSVDRVDTEALRLMVAQAKTRGWKSIKASGDPEFMEALWVEAKRMGMEIDGYNHPNQAELAPQLRCEYYERTYAALEKRLAAADRDEDKTRPMTAEYKALLNDILSHKKAGGLFREKHPEIMQRLALIDRLNDSTPDNTMQEGEDPAPAADEVADPVNSVQEGKAPPEVVATGDKKPKANSVFDDPAPAPKKPSAPAADKNTDAPQPAGIVAEGEGPRAQYTYTAAVALSATAKTMADSLGLTPVRKPMSEAEIAENVAVVANTAVPQTPKQQKSRGGFAAMAAKEPKDIITTEPAPVEDEPAPVENDNVLIQAPR